MLNLIVGGEVYDPTPLGFASVLVAAGSVEAVGTIDRHAIDATGLGLEVLDARGCLVIPGIVDVHEHLCGGSGEPGFARATPDIQPRELVRSGITSVVGCLGVDTTTKTMPALLARAKALREVGLSAWCWTGGYPVPPTTITGSVRSDIMLIDEVIGAGEVAIADDRASGASGADIARLARESHAGGLLAGKAGLTHLHVGPGGERLSSLREAIDRFGIPPPWLYPTHVERNEALFDEALALCASGAFVDVDVCERDLGRWLGRWRDRHGPSDRITASSDAGLMRPDALLGEIRRCHLEDHLPLDWVLAVVTANPAAALGLVQKGRLLPGKDADVLVLTKDGLVLRDVFARGRRVMRDGELLAPIAFADNTRLDWIDAPR